MNIIVEVMVQNKAFLSQKILLFDIILNIKILVYVCKHLNMFEPYSCVYIYIKYLKKKIFTHFYFYIRMCILKLYL